MDYMRPYHRKERKKERNKEKKQRKTIKRKRFLGLYFISIIYYVND